MMILKKFFRFLFYSFFIVMDVFLISFAGFISIISIPNPTPSDASLLQLNRKNPSADFYTLNQNWLKKSNTGLWEMYVEGDGFERGVIEGKLTKELSAKQELAFVNEIKQMIPSQAMLNYLKFFIAFFNRHLDEFIVDEYKQEIYGESLFASDDFDYIAPNYYRMLNYHAAHDIGHALQDKNMAVGCTAFAAWADKTDDSTLLIARNFDFYVGEAFAENKLINFIKPKTGYKLMMISWAGMIGTVSGMNEKGLTVTLNAAKSEIPTSAATPISLVAREILQYAKNIDEAFAIAKKRKTFVSESILVGSLEDNRTATIEKTPSRTELFNSPNPDYIICANHFQGKAFQSDIINQENIQKSSSEYRFQRLEQLIHSYLQISIASAAAILRNQKGMNETAIGMGNEKALNQLLAHHSVIFKPARLQVWISTNPFQLGQYVCYDLNKVFAQAPSLSGAKELYEKQLNIPADSFLYSNEYKKFIAFKQMRTAFRFLHKHQLHYDVDARTIAQFIKCNSDFFETYQLLGTYYKDKKNNTEALKYYNLALTKEIPTVQEREAIEKELK